jgi:Phytanoyl-CoA dioxygenase (PhyH)
MDTMTKRAAFEFDLQGFVILRNLIDSGQVESLNAIIDGDPIMRRTTPKFLFATKSPLFMDLLSHPTIMKLCEAWIHPQFKFDNAWGIHYPAGHSGNSHENLHAGPFQNQGYFQYHWVNGRPFSSCIVVGWVLADQRPGDGGLMLVPGSHKSQALQSGWEVRQLLDNRFEASWIVQPELFASDAVVFSEATIHGTARWTPRDRFRRNLYYKYSLGFTAFYPGMDEETVTLRRLARTELERNLLREAYVSNVRGQGENPMVWRSKTIPSN